MEVNKYQIDKYRGINFVLYEDYQKLEKRITELEHNINACATKPTMGAAAIDQNNRLAERISELEKDKADAITIAKYFQRHIAEYPDNDEGDFLRERIRVISNDLKQLEKK